MLLFDTVICIIATVPYVRSTTTVHFRMKRRKFRADFVGYFDVRGSRVFILVLYLFLSHMMNMMNMNDDDDK